MTKRAVISLGSNIDKERNLPAAIRLLAKMCTIISVSDIYETAPVGEPNGPPAGSKERLNFWNAAALVETDLSPNQLREQVLNRIEKKLDRVRTEDKNAPRTIDLDLTLYDDEILELDQDHHIPDPDLLKHVHVARPVAELIPQGLHPETGQSYEEIARNLENSIGDHEHIALMSVSEVDTRQLLSKNK